MSTHRYQAGTIYPKLYIDHMLLFRGVGWMLSLEIGVICAHLLLFIGWKHRYLWSSRVVFFMFCPSKLELPASLILGVILRSYTHAKDSLPFLSSRRLGLFWSSDCGLSVYHLLAPKGLFLLLNNDLWGLHGAIRRRCAWCSCSYFVLSSRASPNFQAVARHLSPSLSPQKLDDGATQIKDMRTELEDWRPCHLLTGWHQRKNTSF